MATLPYMGMPEWPCIAPRIEFVLQIWTKLWLSRTLSAGTMGVLLLHQNLDELIVLFCEIYKCEKPFWSEKMGKEQSKEEIVIAQNAAGGENRATTSLDDIRFHLSIVNIILGLAVLMCCCGSCLGMWNLYKKCHVKWIQREITHNSLRRSFGRRQLENKNNPV